MKRRCRRIVQGVFKKEAQFFENWSLSEKCYSTSKKTIVCIGILEIPEKSELLLIVTAKLLQKPML
jgi:hypothetical protein